FNKTRANLDGNPKSQVRVVDPETVREYVLDLHYLHTETHGPIFEQMDANNEAIAAAAGMSGVFRLRGVDIHRVLRCAQVAGTGAVRQAAPERSVLSQLDEFTRRLGLCTGYEEATQTALQALDDLFGFRHAILLMLEPDRERLFAVAGNGYATPAAGAEVLLDTGPAGVAVSSRRVITMPNLVRGRVMQSAMQPAAPPETPGRSVPLPALREAQSLAAIPLVVEGAVRGVLLLESTELGAFGAHNERLLRIVGAHLASVLGALDPSVSETARPPEGTLAEPAAEVGVDPLRVTYYHADDSV